MQLTFGLRVKLAGARVWATGASSGIGEAVVAGLVRAGARVAITARGNDDLRRVAARYGTAERPVLALPADVTQPDAVKSVVARLESDWGGLDLAFFNAGTYRPVSGTAFAAEDVVETMRVNVFGAMFGAEAVLPGMLRQGRGRIAVTSSLVGLIPLPNAAAYGASKAALTYAFEALRFDLQPRGVGVTIIHPGFVRTPLTRANRFHMPALMDSDAAAAVILRGLAADQDEIDFPRWVAWTVKTIRRLPFPLYKHLVALTIRPP
ncbi:MAG: SDR family NAD(P)-dependent oxidoreductase [Chloroflexota bacterium]|nr:SDR family NAD(P)-dependent oxidoreductase [Chloroflexota bacterium]